VMSLLRVRACVLGYYTNAFVLLIYNRRSRKAKSQKCDCGGTVVNAGGIKPLT